MEAMEEQIDGAAVYPDLPIEAACPACGARTQVRIKHNNDFIDFDMQDGKKPLAGSYTYKGMNACSCDRLLRVYLSVTARDVED